MGMQAANQKTGYWGDSDAVAGGYNHNILYRTHPFHIQTEDSGRTRGHIFTHVFCSGAIVASQRIDYGPDVTFGEVVCMAQDSHKSMMRKLVHGLLDSDIARFLGRSTPAPREPLRVAPPLPSDTEDHSVEKLRQLIENIDMDNINKILSDIQSNVTATLGAALVDYESGMCLGTIGTGLNMEVAAAGNMEVMKAKSRVMRDLGIKGGIEDILITLDSQYHIIRPVGSALFLYLAIDRAQGNLALARHKLSSAAKEISI